MKEIACMPGMYLLNKLMSKVISICITFDMSVFHSTISLKACRLNDLKNVNMWRGTTMQKLSNGKSGMLLNLIS